MSLLVSDVATEDFKLVGRLGFVVPKDGQFRVTAILAGHGVNWHLAGIHCSPIAAPGSLQ